MVMTTGSTVGPKSTRTVVSEALSHIEDPELPVRIVDLGMVREIGVDGAAITVRLLPTFLACPARWLVEAEVRNAVEALDDVEVCRVEWLPGGWTAADVTSEGRRALAEVGMALPDRAGQLVCPFCGSVELQETSPFGSAVCRSAAYCPSCQTPVEVMKTKR
jgi:ring-1,2-phenylacetyl-CoA epoxidase subunit PaaD